MLSNTCKKPFDKTFSAKCLHFYEKHLFLLLQPVNFFEIKFPSDVGFNQVYSSEGSIIHVGLLSDVSYEYKHTGQKFSPITQDLVKL